LLTGLKIDELSISVVPAAIWLTIATNLAATTGQAGTGRSAECNQFKQFKQ
jgi:hypothetical protein